jgi:hypothetical protein
MQIRCRVVQNRYFDSKLKILDLLAASVCAWPLETLAFSSTSILFDTTLLHTWANWPPKSYTFMGQLPSKTLQIRCRVIQNQYFDSKRKYMICSLPLSVRALSRLSHFSYKSFLYTYIWSTNTFEVLIHLKCKYMWSTNTFEVHIHLKYKYIWSTNT